MGQSHCFQQQIYHVIIIDVDWDTPMCCFEVQTGCEENSAICYVVGI